MSTRSSISGIALRAAVVLSVTTGCQQSPWHGCNVKVGTAFFEIPSEVMVSSSIFNLKDDELSKGVNLKLDRNGEELSMTLLPYGQYSFANTVEEQSFHSDLINTRGRFKDHKLGRKGDYTTVFSPVDSKLYHLFSGSENQGTCSDHSPSNCIYRTHFDNLIIDYDSEFLSVAEKLATDKFIISRLDEMRCKSGE